MKNHIDSVFSPNFNPVFLVLKNTLMTFFKSINCFEYTLPETNIAHENPIFPGKYHQNGGFSMAMLVYRSVDIFSKFPMLAVVNKFLTFFDFGVLKLGKSR